MTRDFKKIIFSSHKINSTNPLFKHSASCFALLVGLQLGTPVFAASQDSLRPNPPAQSVLDPKSEKDNSGVELNQNKPVQQNGVVEGEGTPFRVKAIKLVGNKIYSNDELMAVLTEGNTAVSVTGMLTFNQLQKLAGKITSYYQNNGYIVGQAVIPEQDVTNGVVTIHIIEGRIDKVRADAKAWNKDNKLVEEFNKIYNDTGITNDNLTYTMARLGEATGTVGSVNLQPSNKVGGSEVVLYTRDLPLFFYGFTADNFGGKSLGVYRGNAFVGGNSWLTDGDYTRLEFGATNEFSRSNRFDLTYSIPIGFSGWTGSVRTWRTEYNLGGTFAATHATGEAQAGEAAMNYALHRSASARADWKTGYSFVYLSDKVGSVNANRDRHVQSVWTGLAGYAEDTLLKTRARTVYTTGVTAGQLAFEDPVAKAADKTGVKTEGSFAFLTASASREQVLFDDWSVFAWGRGQIANKNLDSYNKMALGGPTAVRAYSGGESAGDNVVIGTSELRYLYTFSLFERTAAARLAAFYDLGWSQINVTPLPTTTEAAKTATRGGYGLELNIFWNNTVAWQIFWAHTSDNTRISQADGKRSRVGTALSASF